MALTQRVGRLALGTAVGQGAILLATPWLARLYPPAAFGELALFMTLASYAASCGCLRYDVALASGRAEERDALLTLCLIAGTTLAIFAGLACTLPWRRWSDSDLVRLTEQPWLVVATMAGVAWYQAASNDLVNQSRFSRLAAARALQGLGFAALAAARVAGLTTALACSYVIAAATGWRRLRPVPLRELAATALRHLQFPLLSLPGALCDVLAASMVIVVMTDAYGLGQVGQYSQVQRLIGAPLLLVSASLFQVYLRRATEDHQAGRPLVAPLLRLSSRSLLLVGAALAVVLLLGEPVMRLVLGTAWRVDTMFLLQVLGGLALRVCVSPFSSMLIITGRMKTLLAWQVSYLATSALVLHWAARRVGFDTFLSIHVVHETLLYGAYYLLIYWAARAAEAKT